jgi:uncharacterized protein
MPAGLPLYVAATTAVARRAGFEAALPVARLQRLADCLADSAGELEVRLQAGADSCGAPRLSGSVSGELHLLCQRCLRRFEQRFEVAVNLRLVHSDAEEARLMHDCEPYRVVDDRLPLHEIVEDEVMLALPLAPRCGRTDCHEPGTATETER